MMNNIYQYKDQQHTVLLSNQEEKFVFEIDAKRYTPEFQEVEPGHFLFQLQDKVDAVVGVIQGDRLLVSYKGDTYELQRLKTTQTESQAAYLPKRVEAPMTGKILQILVAECEAVQVEQPLLVLESMKMEITLCAPFAGTVKAVLSSIGDSVIMGQELVQLEPQEK